ncbi:spermidine synthase [Hydrogenophaga sp. Root209]|uniref:spermine/spermidine synthase domain-containing protein n=1 Tax=unclassified Hydrogenophaga TaxID=2610897 RepID=UPI0006F6F0A1|nr:spermidine synthase [Hydrogenophaga sp. Root209]KRC04127.1 spermidine synthase [Hydrogenophaga sp. Root209]
MKAGANAAARKRSTVQTLPEVTISEDSEVRFLHLGTEWIQGSMLLDAPFDIELDYVQRMMAWLLFVEPDSVSKRRALQLGLGSAALTKFCFKKLRMDTTAIEINPQVVVVCRNWFKLPADGPRLRVVLADAGEEIRRADHLGAYDALQVDLYDHEAAAPVLDSPDFYADCRNALTDEGCLTVNLFGRDASYERSLQSLCAAFGDDAVWAFKPTREGNTVVLAQRTPHRPTRMQLLARAELVQERWGLPAVKWLKLFKPVA